MNKVFIQEVQPREALKLVVLTLTNEDILLRMEDDVVLKRLCMDVEFPNAL